MTAKVQGRLNRYFRGVRVELECSHQAELSSDRYRLSKDLAAILVGAAARKGVWCFRCKAHCQPVRNLGTVRMGHATRELAR